MPGARISARFRSFTRNNIRVRTPQIIAGAQAIEAAYALELIQMLRDEPAELPNQTYRRTHTLRDSWKIQPGDPRVLPSGIICRVINDAHDGRKYYATYVQGPWQVAIHQGRWLRAEGGENGPVDMEVVELRRRFAADMRKLVRSNIGFI